MIAEQAEDGDPFQLCGSTLAGKYRVEELVGGGGFGVVYRGVHTGFGEPIAIKCLRVADDLPEPERASLLDQLREEGAVLHRLSKRCAAIVQALDVDATVTPAGSWVPYLVLEWLEGETLNSYLFRRLERGQALSVREAVELLAPAFDALAQAHRRKVAHRDVKPDNLFLERAGGAPTLKLLDFGIAKVLSGHASFTASPAATRERPSAFTPLYGAPEQFNKRLGASGPWTDVFALALVLVEMVTGRQALEGDNPTQLYVAATNPDVRPTMRYHGVDPGDAIEQVLRRALAIEPQERLPDAGVFWDELQQALQSAPEPTRVPIEATGEFLRGHAERFGLSELSAQPTAEAREVNSGATPMSLAETQEAATLPQGAALPTETRPRAQGQGQTASHAPSPGPPGEPSGTPRTSQQPIAQFEVQVIDLARRGVPLTLPNVVAETGLTRENAHAWLEELSERQELQRDNHDPHGPRYRVPGLTLAPPPSPGALAIVRRTLFAWLQIRPEIAPRIPPQDRKSVPFGMGIAALIPFFGLLYAAPLWSALLVTVAIGIVTGAATSLPLIGGALELVSPLVWLAVNALFGGAYTWHYNRHGKRTALRAVNYDAELAAGTSSARDSAE